jgi:hypothetical protein
VKNFIILRTNYIQLRGFINIYTQIFRYIGPPPDELEEESALPPVPGGLPLLGGAAAAFGGAPTCGFNRSIEMASLLSPS